MSKLDALLGYVGDYESIPLEQELNVSPSWSVQNGCLTFSVGMPYKGKPRPNKIAVPQALPSLPIDGYLDSPRGKEFSFSWRGSEEQGFSYPWNLGFPDADLLGYEAQATLRGPSEELSGKYCYLDRGSEVQQSSSSEVINETLGGHMDLACPVLDDRATEGLREIYSENNGDGEWEGVVKLVQELSSRFADPKCAGNTGMEQFEQKIDQKKTDKTGDQPKTECGLPALTVDGTCTMGVTCGIGIPADEIIKALSGIQRNVEYIKEAVPKIASKKKYFTALVKRQCAAAAGAVKLISQLADVAAGIIPEIQRQVSAFPSESCQSSNGNPNKQADSLSVLRREGGNDECAAMERLIPTLAAVSVSPASVISVKPVPQEPGAVKGNNLAATGASEFVRDEKECASSLVADLLGGPCDRMTGADGFVGSTSSTPFQWGNDLEEAIRAGSVPQLRSEENLQVEHPDDGTPSGTTAGSDEEPYLGSSCGAAAHEESDEGDTKGGDQLPLGSFTLMEIDDLEILTEQTHYCNICSKGFKRDANLRMHMRSHGGKYKSSTALIRSERAPKVVQEMVGGKPTRYSCPYVGCNRNVRHPKFQALKTMLCLKNHYRRSHCAKTLKCSICKSKQFSVVADLKTHEKHCGSDKWACSCGTTFSRKEKLYGHVSLFVGHVPVDATAAAHAAASEVSMSAAPLQVQLIHDKGSLAAQNEAVSLWQGW